VIPQTLIAGGVGGSIWFVLDFALPDQKVREDPAKIRSQVLYIDQASFRPEVERMRCESDEGDEGEREAPSSRLEIEWV
jgi:hypothetical protein